VAYRVLHPKLPIEPGIVKVKTSLSTLTGRVALANSITLTPGTLTVDLTDDGYLYVHWINVRAVDVEEATRKIVKRFEPILKEVFG
jgi:multicomponent Na+:H+ antiporter subunit E